MRKKILILISSGGNGHKAIARALKEYLEADYTVQVQDVFLEILQPLDLLCWITRGRVTETGAYNYFLQRSWHAFLNGCCFVGMWWYWLRAKRVYQLMRDNLFATTPDMILSVAPFVSGPLYDAAVTCNIPLLIIPTDFDVPHFVQKLRWRETKNPCALTIGMYAPDEYMVKRVHALTHIPLSCMTVIGVPLYKEFLSNNTTVACNVPLSSPIITVMFGGMGGVRIIALLHVLKQLSMPCVLNVCIGHNESLVAEIQKIPFPDHITIIIIPFTLAIGSIIAKSDLIITKSGGSTLAQAMALGVPILVDATTKTLLWERYNQTFIVQNCCGMVARTNAEIITYVGVMLSPSFYADFAASTHHLRQHDASVMLPLLVKRMLSCINEHDIAEQR